MGRRAFTLVELLVVMGIIALLVAVLLPTLNRSREQARAAVCLSQLRQIGVGVTLYANANRGYYPYNSHGGGGESWLVSLYAFGLNPAVRVCPADPTDRSPAGTSYATNNYTVPQRPYTKLTSIPRSTETVYAAETRKTGDHLHANNYLTAADVANEVAVTRHQGGANYLYCDGHADRIPHEQLQKTFSAATSSFDPATAR